MLKEKRKDDVVAEMSQRGGFSFRSMYMFVKNDEDIAKYNLFEILGANDAMLTKRGHEVLKFVEGEDFLLNKLYLKFKWKVLAFTMIQDTFSGELYDDDADNIGLKNYFYYEGLYLLREYIYCGFNNCLSGAKHLLRTIMEFNIKQLYFEKRCRQVSSYKPMKEYLHDGRCCSAASMVNKVFGDHKITIPLKKSISSMYSGLSKVSSHAYIPTYSARSSGKMQHEYSIDSALFWLDLNMVLGRILWMYYFCHPQLFNPKDVVKKFGFNPPCGCFITDNQHFAIKKSLCESDYKMFMDFAMSDECVINFNNLYDSVDDLSRKQIEATWDRDLGVMPNDKNEAYCIALARIRGIQELMASSISLKTRKEIENGYSDISDKTLGDMDSYAWAIKNYKNM